MSWLPKQAPSQLSEGAINIFFIAHRAIVHRDSPAKGAGEAERQEVESALEAYRMAATNLPRKDDMISLASDQLLETMKKIPGLTRFYEQQLEANSARSVAGGKHTNDPWNPSVMEKMHRVAHGIYVGSYHPANDAALLKSHGITHVCCCINVAPRHPSEFAYITLPADDHAGYDMSQHFDKTYQFIDSALTNGGGVLIHCGAGISRAPTVTAAYLIRKLGISAEEAVGRIRSARPCASPNLGFSQQLKEFSAKQLAQRKETVAAEDTK
jgi:hypothetical protein